MKPLERQQWIEAWMSEGIPGRGIVNVLDSDFVCAYADATSAPVEFQHIGAPKCKQLGRDLSAMFDAGKLTRDATGLAAGDAAMGFPKWVYTYELKAQD